MTALAAPERAECRGSRWRTDHLGHDDERWLKHSLARYDSSGRPELACKGVIIAKYPPQEREY